jgi:hypothetical protein
MTIARPTALYCTLLLTVPIDEHAKSQRAHSKARQARRPLAPRLLHAFPDTAPDAGTCLTRKTHQGSPRPARGAVKRLQFATAQGRLAADRLKKNPILRACQGHYHTNSLVRFRISTPSDRTVPDRHCPTAGDTSISHPPQRCRCLWDFQHHPWWGGPAPFRHPSSVLRPPSSALTAVEARQGCAKGCYLFGDLELTAAS